MKNIARKLGKGFKKIVREGVQTCKEIFFSEKNRKVLGVILIGFGAGLFMSGYIN